MSPLSPRNIVSNWLITLSVQAMLIAEMLGKSLSNTTYEFLTLLNELWFQLVQSAKVRFGSC